jgi:lipopolysaccharide assembly outer membrane protein LptD (OstA)
MEKGNKTLYRASGNVRIVIQDILITCDAAEYDEAIHIGKTSGRTEIIQGQSQAIGFRCEFDLNQQPPRLLIMK